MGRVIRQLRGLLDVAAVSPAFNRVLAWSPTISKFVYRKLRPYEDVTDYGAVGDGTTISTAAIQAAVDAACAAGGSRCVYFPAAAGHYRTGEIVIPDGAGLRIYGDGRLLSGIKCLAAGNTIFSFTTTAPSYLHIHGLGLYGVGRSTGLSTACGILIQDCGIPLGVHIHDLYIRDFRRHGIALGSLSPNNNGSGPGANIENVVWSSSVHDIHLYDIGDHGIWGQSLGPTVYFRNIVCAHPSLTGSTYNGLGDGRGYALAVRQGEIHCETLNIGDNPVTPGQGGGAVLLGVGVRAIFDTCHFEGCDGVFVHAVGAMFTFRNSLWSIGGHTTGTDYVGIRMGPTLDLCTIENSSFQMGAASGVGGWSQNEPIHCVGGEPNLKVLGKRTSDAFTRYANNYYAVTDAAVKPIATESTVPLIDGVWTRHDRHVASKSLKLALCDQSAFSNFGTTGRAQKEILICDDATTFPTATYDGVATTRGDLGIYDIFRLTKANAAVGIGRFWNGSSAETLKWGAVQDTHLFPMASFELTEQGSDPAAVANAGKLFTRDNGSGKTQLCVRFGSGAVQVIATEP